ncbi:MAG: serpin family protein [Candidatus Pacebacteria bacterium]|nr:serpin family protein [Candidatus Paceibacterota bacterium]
MNKKILIILILIVGAVLAVSLYGNKEPDSISPPPVNGGGVSLENIGSVVDANNQFALDLYSKYKSEESNVFFSPYSISTALAMTYEGAKGQTAEEMRCVFYFPEDDSERRSDYAGLYNELNKKDKEYKLSTANALWAQENYLFLDEYFGVVEEYYGGKVTNLDFMRKAEESRIMINDWVEDKTNDKIKDLIPSGVINSMTKLVLTNAIYFKGQWAKQFNEDNTSGQDFKVTSDKIVEVSMMQSTDDESEFNYTENDELQVLELPYSGDDLSMLIFLPKDDDIKTFENSITVERLIEWKKDLREQRVDVFIPRFKFETKYFMAETLKEMGMPTAFSGSADFSGMTGKRDLFISAVIHQAFVEVNEEGTEAAAATAVVMELTSAAEPAPIPTFRADHPFVFIIQEKGTGSILFIGRVSDPSE